MLQNLGSFGGANYLYLPFMGAGGDKLSIWSEQQWRHVVDTSRCRRIPVVNRCNSPRDSSLAMKFPQNLG